MQSRKQTDPRRWIRISIATKLSALVSTLLLGALASLVWLSTRIYVDDSTGMLRQMNVDAAANLARQSRELVERVADRLVVIAATSVARSPGSEEPAAMRELFARDESLLGAIVWSRQGDKASVAWSRFPRAGADGDGEVAKATALAALEERPQFSLESAFRGQPQVASVRLGEGNEALAVAVPVLRDGSAFTHVAAGFVSRERLEEIFSANDLVTSSLVDGAGRMLATGARITASVGLPQKLVDEMRASEHHNGEYRFRGKDGESRIAAFHRVGFAGLSVVSDVPEAKAFEAAKWVQYRSTLLAIVVLCASVLVGHLFSGSLTSPIYDLVRAAVRVGRGDFKVDLKVKGRDEVGYLSHAFNSMARGLEERDRLKATFQKFHDKEIAERLLSGDVALGGERREVAVLFTDIRNFTRLSEQMTPERVVEMLNEYMSAMVAAIGRHGGVVDKYVGDAILALWGVPESRDDDVLRALRGCLAMRRELEGLNARRRERGDVAIEIGMGLNFGPVVAGNIGSPDRMEYTVIGDTVNVASRIESATKEQGEPILVAESAVRRAGAIFRFGEPRLYQAKGKSEEITLYPLLGEAGAEKQAA
jgi:adenylate cyclase